MPYTELSIYRFLNIFNRKISNTMNKIYMSHTITIKLLSLALKVASDWCISLAHYIVSP